MEKEKVNGCVNKLNTIAQKAIKCKDVDKACMLIRISSKIQNAWNQNYTDDDLEKCIEIMADKKKSLLDSYKENDDVILFYDGFGLDTRGLALIYVKALCELGYSVVYLVPEVAKNNQPEIKKVTDGKDITFVYLQKSQGDELITEILDVVTQYRPRDAFFYTTPDDVEACIAFSAMEKRIRRFQINLTDHAFWLGRNAFDYCIEFREYGACVSNEYRKIPADKIKLLHYYPYFDKSIPFAGFPFETDNRPIMFSGGSLYKTFDEDGTYYDMVEQIMRKHEDLIFAYAGYGDRSGLEELQNKFPKRVYIMDERKDLFGLMRHCTLYLNTYPMLGGLMTQYAAIAGRLPLTIADITENSLDGLLLNREELSVEFKNKDDLIKEADKLLSDVDYRKNEEEKLNVVDEDIFRCELENLLNKEKTIFDIHFHHIDTRAFRKQYEYRFLYDNLANMIIKSKTMSIWLDFPELLFYRKIGRPFIKLFNKVKH